MRERTSVREGREGYAKGAKGQPGKGFRARCEAEVLSTPGGARPCVALRPVSSPAMLEQRIQQHFIDSADLKYQAAQTLSKPIAAGVQALLACVTSGGKVLACGNGGSAADAQHFSAEFVGRFERERPELGAIALTTDSSILTAIANDYAYDRIFSKQVRALGQAGDVLLAL